jgi:mevalonate kinase
MLRQGCIFDSSIPQGYGVGSSGALVAAIYDNIMLKIKSRNLENLTVKNYQIKMDFFLKWNLFPRENRLV